MAITLRADYMFTNGQTGGDAIELDMSLVAMAVGDLLVAVTMRDDDPIFSTLTTAEAWTELNSIHQDVGGDAAANIKYKVATASDLTDTYTWTGGNGNERNMVWMGAYDISDWSSFVVGGNHVQYVAGDITPAMTAADYTDDCIVIGALNYVTNVGQSVSTATVSVLANSRALHEPTAVHAMQVWDKINDGSGNALGQAPEWSNQSLIESAWNTALMFHVVFEGTSGGGGGGTLPASELARHGDSLLRYLQNVEGMTSGSVVGALNEYNGITSPPRKEYKEARDTAFGINGH